MKYKLKIYSIWEYGQRVDAEGKPHQEDSLFPAYGQQKDSDRLFILCDGMGGHAAGEVASATVCEAMSRSVFESTPDAEGDFSDDCLRKAIADAFRALDKAASDDVSDEKKMGTTMTFLKFHSRGCTIAHMGDSRVYHIRPGKDRDDTEILFQTSDHSLVNDLIKVGELTPEEAKYSKQKNIITRAMQPNMERQPKADIYHTADIRKGDWFYMCSDGMLEQMEDDNLRFNFSEKTGDDRNKVKILTQATSQNRDNHTAIIVHVTDVIDPLPADGTSGASAAAPAQPPIMAEVEGNPGNDKPMTGEAAPQSDEKETRTASAPSSGKKRNPLTYILMAAVALAAVAALYFLSSGIFSRQTPETPPPAPVSQPSQKPRGGTGTASEPVPQPTPQAPAKPETSSQTGGNAESPASISEEVQAAAAAIQNPQNPPEQSTSSQPADPPEEDVVNSDTQTALDALNQQPKK